MGIWPWIQFNFTNTRILLYSPTVKECKDIADAKSGIYTTALLNLHTFKLRCEDENWTV